jgi:hypothetical protein
MEGFGLGFKRSFCLVGVMAAMAAAGCGGSDLSVGPATAQAFCDSITDVFADAEVRCYGGSAADWAMQTGDTCADLAPLKATVQYDRSMAAGCLATIKARLATACTAEFDCIDQAVKGLVPNGQPCTSSAECAPNVFCLRDDDTTCDQSVCTAQAAIGAPCGTAGCATGSTCGASGTCEALIRGDAGATCGDPVTQECKDGLICFMDPNSIATTGTCQASGLGTACATDFDCPLEAFCDRTCKARLAIGVDCTDHDNGCQVLAVCDLVTNRCAAAGHVGQPCGAYGFCLNGSCELGSGDPGLSTSSTCVAPAALGAACQFGSDCASGVCHNEVCTDCPR